MTDKLKGPEEGSEEAIAAKALETMIKKAILLKQALELGKTTIEELTPEETAILLGTVTMEPNDSIFKTNLDKLNITNRLLAASTPE